MVKNQNIVTLTPDAKEIVRYLPNSNKEILGNLKHINKNDFRISYLDSNKFVSEVVEINRNIPEEDLKDAIELEVYEELKLNYSEEYKILYVENKMTVPEKAGHRVFDTFVINMIDLEGCFKPLEEKLSFIDYIVPAPLLFKSLYNKQVLSKNSDGVDCFISFGEDDSSVAIYKNGEYLYSKSFSYSFSKISEKISELLGQELSLMNFYAQLSNTSNPNEVFTNHLQTVFKEIFLHVNEILSFAKRIKKINKFGKIYISTESSKLDVVLNIAKEELSSYEVDALKVSYKNYSFESNPLHALMFLSARDYIGDYHSLFNMTYLPRPIPLHERESGKLMNISLVALLLASLYPLGETIYSYKLKLDTASVNAKSLQLSKNSNNVQAKIIRLNKQKDDLEDKIKLANEALENKYTLTNQIHKSSISYTLRSKVFTDLLSYVSGSGVFINGLDTNGSNIYMDVQSRKDKKITRLIKNIDFDERFRAYTSEVAKDANATKYTSRIRVSFYE